MNANISDLISASSIGDGLRDIKERGIDKHVADLEAKPKRRTKAKSPTQRTLEELRKRGWTAQVVERWNPHAKVRQDLFGVIDLVAISPAVDGKPSAIVGIQATVNSGGAHAARRAKILAEPRAKLWVDAGGRLEIWSWAQQGWRGKRKLWTLRVETYDEMVAGAT